MALTVDDFEVSVEGVGVEEALWVTDNEAMTEEEPEGVAEEAADPVNALEGDTELLAHGEEVGGPVKVAEGVTLVLPETEEEGEREGLWVNESDPVPLAGVEGDASDEAVTRMDALTDTEEDGHTVAELLAEREEPADDEGGMVGVGTEEGDAGGVLEWLPHTLVELVCEEDSVYELDGEGVMVAESVETPEPEGVLVGVMVPDVDVIEVPVPLGEDEEEMVGE